MVKCFGTALRVSEECVLPMSILQKGNASVIPVPACSFGTPNNTNFCHELWLFFVVNVINGLVAVLWNRTRVVVWCVWFFLVIISHPDFSFQLDSRESRGSSGQSQFSYIVLPVGQYRLLGFWSHSKLMVFKGTEGTNAFPGRWMSSQLVAFPGSPGVDTKRELEGRRERTMALRDRSSWMCLRSTSSQPSVLFIPKHKGLPGLSESFFPELPNSCHLFLVFMDLQGCNLNSNNKKVVRNVFAAPDTGYWLTPVKWMTHPCYLRAFFIMLGVKVHLVPFSVFSFCCSYIVFVTHLPSCLLDTRLEL